MEEPGSDQEVVVPQKKRDSNIAPTGGFDCNICLEFAQDPVVTLCGHLYCWPCIYKWLNLETSTTQQCPVCKASLSETTLVPLYARGHTPTPKPSKHQKGRVVSLPKLDIPNRPPANRPADSLNSPRNSLNRHHHHVHHHQHFHQDYVPSPLSMNFQANFPASTPRTTHGFHPTASALAEMVVSVLPWLFGCPGAGMYSSIPGTPNMMNTPRLRQQDIQAESIVVYVRRLRLSSQNYSSKFVAEREDNTPHGRTLSELYVDMW
ncbi:uncharacterized protein LOC143858240 [Tasmannia lanceolata]|uniref:uncharacterized protein LOC143858240 n=1 Tax=Tasmannia lanceolata TaxID=3420 RepID=UPI004063FFD2